MSLKEQIIAVRDSGKTNMLDSRTVQYIASEMNFYELVIVGQRQIKKCIFVQNIPKNLANKGFYDLAYSSFRANMYVQKRRRKRP